MAPLVGVLDDADLWATCRFLGAHLLFPAARAAEVNPYATLTSLMLSSAQSIRAVLWISYPVGGAVLPVTEGKQARQIHILSLQMTRVVDDSASILRVRQLLPEQPAECVLQTTNLGNASQSGTARMIPQDGQLE